MRINFRIFQIALAASFAWSLHTIASASALNVIYGFCSLSGCADGSNPIGNLVRDNAGNLYGVTINSPHGGGIIYELTPNGGSWTEHVLYDFCYDGSCPGGAGITSGLVIDNGGNLYGTTYEVAHQAGGTVFELSPDAQHQHWTLKVLYQFCKRAGCKDGAGPSGLLSYAGASSGAPYDGVSPLYGTTAQGGKNASGTVVELDPAATRSTSWTETVLHHFCARACADGENPQYGVIVDGTGNLYGTSDEVIFKLSRGKLRWKITALHEFCFGDDGCDPRGSLAFDSAGDVYGVTQSGGNRALITPFAGIVYKLTLSTGTPQYSVYYKFCHHADCLDGATPFVGLSIAASGTLYGATVAGGDSASGFDGVLFSLSPREKVLHQFCLTDCKDGSRPEGELFVAPNGHLFGTAQQAGPHNGGEVFEYVP